MSAAESISTFLPGDERALAAAVVTDLTNFYAAAERGIERYARGGSLTIWSRGVTRQGYDTFLDLVNEELRWLDSGYWNWAYWLDDGAFDVSAAHNRLKRRGERLLERAARIRARRSGPHSPLQGVAAHASVESAASFFDRSPA